MTFDTSKLGSWKTTLAGVVSLIAGFVAFSPGLFTKWPWVTEAAKYLMLGSTGAGLITAKDSGVTGGTTLASGSVPDAQLHAAAANEAPASAKAS